MISGWDLRLIEESLHEAVPIDPNLGDAPLPPAELIPSLVHAVHASRSAVMLTDAELDRPGPRVLYVNPAFEHLSGYTAEELREGGPRILQGESTDRAVLDQLRGNLAAGFGFEGVLLNYSKHGRRYIASLRISPVRVSGRTIAYVAIVDNVTESWLMRLQRSERERALADVSTAVDDQSPEDVEIVHLARPAEPSQLTGDWSDVVTDAIGRVHLIVGDASGHGAIAGIFATRYRWPLVALLRAGIEPGRALRMVDAMNRDVPAMASIGLVTIAPSRKWATVITAGHPDVVVVDGGRVRRVSSGGALVGAAMADCAGRPARVTLSPGAVVCLYSDGLVERRAEALDDRIDQLGESVRGHLSSAPLGPAASAVAGEMLGGPSDDVVLLMARTGASVHSSSLPPGQW